MLERWMDNEPTILGSDTDVLKSIANGACDVGLTNSYYLGRELEDDEDFPVAPVWADQKGRGTHLNLSGIGVVKGADQADEAKKLVRYLTEPEEQRVFAQNNHEFGVDSLSDTTPEIKQFGELQEGPDRRGRRRAAPGRRRPDDELGGVEVATASRAGARRARAARRTAGRR